MIEKSPLKYFVIMVAVAMATGLVIPLVAGAIFGPAIAKGLPMGSFFGGAAAAALIGGGKGNALPFMVGGAAAGSLGWILALVVLGVAV